MLSFAESEIAYLSVAPRLEYALLVRYEGLGRALPALVEPRHNCPSRAFHVLAVVVPVADAHLLPAHSESHVTQVELRDIVASCVPADHMGPELLPVKIEDVKGKAVLPLFYQQLVS